MTQKEIEEDGVERYKKAYYPPKDTPKKAFKIFLFLRNNDNHCTVAGGMQHYVTGLDKERLITIAKEYGIELSRYMFLVEHYQNKLLLKQNREMSQKNK